MGWSALLGDALVPLRAGADLETAAGLGSRLAQLLEAFLCDLLAGHHDDWSGHGLDLVDVVSATCCADGDVLLMGLALRLNGGMSPFRLLLHGRRGTGRLEFARLSFGESGLGSLGLLEHARQSKRATLWGLHLKEGLEPDWRFECEAGLA